MVPSRPALRLPVISSGKQGFASGFALGVFENPIRTLAYMLLLCGARLVT
jgi:hypothetical protein